MDSGFYCCGRSVFSAALSSLRQLEKAHGQTDRSSSLQAPRASTGPPHPQAEVGGESPLQKKKKKMPGGDKDRLTHTHTQASGSTNLEAIRNGSRVQCGGTHSFMHWAVGVRGRGAGALRTAEGTHLHAHPTALVLAGKGVGAGRS